MCVGLDLLHLGLGLGVSEIFFHFVHQLLQLNYFFLP